VSFLQPTVQQPKTSADYKKTNFEVLARDVHPVDQIVPEAGWRNDLLHPHRKGHGFQ